MSGDGADALRPSGPWADRARSPRPPRASALFGYLLDLDDDLSDELEVRMRYSARQQATARLLDADAGECELSSWFTAVGDGPGLLVIDGLFAVDTSVADRTTTELLGSGDLLQPPARHEDEIVEPHTVWRALTASRLALLDGEFAHHIRSWPQILNALFRRAERRSHDLDVLRAISCQPRLEVRLVLLLWHLAGRWGRVEPAGLRLTLPLTHRLLGQLVAAERPSISHALRRLTEAGIVTGATGDLHLHGAVEEHLEALIERTPRLSLRPSGARSIDSRASG
jgi:CRP/FNR family cyclic AMP-dependent transcriptional regulator